MQKKLIALAVAGLLSAPAFAQSNVTIYGTVDFGYANMRNSDANGFKSRHGIDSGISRANNIGFKGVEDLGNGLKAVFVLEEGVQGDYAGGSGFFKGNARQSYAGLAGGFGTVAFGRHYTPQHLFTVAVDPFAKNGLGSAGNVLMQERRLNNLAAYISPSWGGFSFIAAYSFNGTQPNSGKGNNENFENDGDVRAWAIAPSFTMGNLFVGANYHAAELNRVGVKDLDALQVYDLFGSYDFGFVKLGATIGRRVTDKDMGFDKDAKLTQWMVGATFKITANDSILTSYSRATESGVATGYSKPRIGQWAIGYEHALSKRTTLYAQFATQSHNRAFKENGFASLVTDGPVGSVGSSNMEQFGQGAHGLYDGQNNLVGHADSSLYRRGFALGFRHNF